MSIFIATLALASVVLVIGSGVWVYQVNRGLVARIREVDPAYYTHLRGAYWSIYNGLDREMRKGATPPHVLEDPSFKALRDERGRILKGVAGGLVVISLGLILFAQFAY